MQKYIKGSFFNGHPFEAVVEASDFNDFMLNAPNSTSDNSPLDMSSLVITDMAEE